MLLISFRVSTYGHTVCTPFLYKYGGTFHRLASSTSMQCTTCTLKAESYFLSLPTTSNTSNQSLFLKDVHHLTSTAQHCILIFNPIFLSTPFFFVGFFFFFRSLNVPRPSSFSLHSHSAWWPHLLFTHHLHADDSLIHTFISNLCSKPHTTSSLQEISI